MKKTLLVLVLLAAFVFPAAAESFTDDLSVGAAVGELFAGTVKYDIDDSLKAAGFFGFSFRQNVYFRAEANYYVPDFEFAIEKLNFYPYFGGGLTIAYKDDIAFGGNVAAGLSYYLNDIPLEVFGEFAPGYMINSNKNFDASIILGARYAL
ncbi:MAG: hypothetical protein K9K78_03565 [Spirochaetales bacterium]|nr:hypothetical protein [Spirochaetales bacterium]